MSCLSREVKVQTSRFSLTRLRMKTNQKNPDIQGKRNSVFKARHRLVGRHQPTRPRAPPPLPKSPDKNPYLFPFDGVELSSNSHLLIWLLFNNNKPSVLATSLMFQLLALRCYRYKNLCLSSVTFSDCCDPQKSWVSIILINSWRVRTGPCFLGIHSFSSFSVRPAARQGCPRDSDGIATEKLRSPPRLTLIVLLPPSLSLPHSQLLSSFLMTVISM